MRALLAVSTISLLAGAVPAQIANIVGFVKGFNASYTDRLGGNAIDVDCLQHFSSRDYRNMFLDPADPAGNTMRIVGLQVRVQDQNGTTPETFTLCGYREDPANPDFPNVSGQPGGLWFRTTTPINFPATGGTGASGTTFLIGINPAAVPLFHNPNLDDVFFGVGLNAGTWPTDGLGVIITHARPTTPPATPPPLDAAGPRIIDVTNSVAPNFACRVPTAGGLPTGATATHPASAGGNHIQLQLDVLARVTGGVSVTQTNQTGYASSNPLNNPAAAVPLGGTTNMLSGLHPDVNDAALATPARADDIGFLISETNRRSSLCAVIAGFGPPSFGIYPDGTIPMAALFLDPDTRGLLCVDPGPTSIIFLGQTNATAGVYQQMFGLTLAQRAQIALLTPFELIWQGFVIDATLTEVLATGCVSQKL